MNDLLRQLMVLIQVIDNDYEAIAERVESPRRKEPGSAIELFTEPAAKAVG